MASRIMPTRVPHGEPTNAEIAALNRRATNVRELMKGAARPLVVEFSGVPRSGKSTCIATVEHTLRRMDFRVYKPVEGASVTPEFLKNFPLEFNVLAATYGVRVLIEGLYIQQPKRYDFILLDRGPFDGICWLSHVREENPKVISRREFKSLTQFLRIAQWAQNIDLVCLYTCSPRESYRRELSDKLIRKGGKATNLQRLLRTYERSIRCYQDDFRELRWFRSTKKSSSRSAAYAILARIFDIVES